MIQSMFSHLDRRGWRKGTPRVGAEVTDEGQFADNESYVRAVHDEGLAHDLAMLDRQRIDRRRALGLMGGGLLGSSLVLTGCSVPGQASPADVSQPATPEQTAGTATPTAATGADTTDLTEVPSETEGPFPADGSRGVDVLTESGIVRSDIRSSFGGPTGVAEGVPLTIELTVADLSSGIAPLVGAAVYVWHCDAGGDYSMYSSAIKSENYLRGVQATDDSGTVRFTSIFPACYSGRWPHIHFEVFASLEDATNGERNIIKTSQIALPQDVCESVFATDGRYSGSTSNLARVSLSSDNVFGEDSGRQQLATVTGDATAGFTAALAIGVR